jgi:hypothetical protein
MQKINNAKIKMQKIKDTTYLYRGSSPKLSLSPMVCNMMLGDDSEMIYLILFNVSTIVCI